MKHSTKVWQALGFAFTSLVGVILHFLYGWVGNAVWAAPFSAVNESTFEHMKLLFWPMFIYAIVHSFFFKENADFWCVKLRGILLGLILIPVVFYTYNGVIGQSQDLFNIAIFFIAAASSYIYESRLFSNGKLRCSSPKFAFTLLCAIALLFVVFTFKTPEIGIFKNPLTGTYGI